MCITAEALALFLNLLSPEIIETRPGQVLVHATEGTAVWEKQEDLWCTKAPQDEAAARL
ncbi:hypothetical protein [Anianabacter salinae]|uniref:hypothetical protein n=1 Tax=Anianabacter salinae TaxID=2851023 RepID=UPI00225E6D08|nr:hypothetical protein [Anianabacter salinae]MBV0912297.1 hypothetical protein [Anianabacter salinae]